jgi:hypothetical protein
MINDPLHVFVRDFALKLPVRFEWETPAGIRRLDVQGIFDSAFFDLSVGETVLDTTAPRLTCRADEIRTLPREAVATIDGSVYSVVQIQTDGTGFATVILAHE